MVLKVCSRLDRGTVPLLGDVLGRARVHDGCGGWLRHSDCGGWGPDRKLGDGAAAIRA